MTDLLSWTHGFALTGALTVAVFVINHLRSNTSTRKTELRGPKRCDLGELLLGQTKAGWGDPAARDVLEEWATEFGSVVQRPGPFGSRDIVIMDPKAAEHVLGSSEKVYHIHPMARQALHSFVGRGLIAADGESHKRQRKAISPGFTSVKMREYTSIFFDCAHKLASRWDTELENSECFVTDANKWFSAFSLDTIGLAGFAHDFGALLSRPSAVGSSFDALTNAKMGIIDAIIIFLSPVIPFLVWFPTNRQQALTRMHAACTDLAKKIIARSKAEEKDERSVMGLLVRAETASSGLTITEEEVTSQVRTLIAAGYETTSVALTWTLTELCRHLDLQARIRAEILAAFPGSDPSYDELTNSLPLLDALVHEILRVHPALYDAFRTAQQDDVIPLSEPITLPDGSMTDKIFIEKGTNVTISIGVLNQSKALWGSDASEFRPERWLEPLPAGALQISGYRHLMTFIDGPKVCLGRSFAVTNMKALLSVLIRRYTYELPKGPETKFGMRPTIVYRPIMEGQDNFTMPVLVRKID